MSIVDTTDADSMNSGMGGSGGGGGKSGSGKKGPGMKKPGSAADRKGARARTVLSEKQVCSLTVSLN